MSNAIAPVQHLPLRTEPALHESLNGYLIRAAGHNRFPGAERLLVHVLGHRGSPTLDDLPALAAFCRCENEEFARLIGFWQHAGADGRHWYIDGQWLTMANFLNPRRAIVCPACLADFGVAHGAWDLSLNTACEIHDSQLLDRCPSCQRLFGWARSDLYHCACGQDIRRIALHKAHDSERWVASLISARLSSPFDELIVNDALLSRLTNTLTLDSLCKLLWLLGWLLPQVASGTVITGRRKPTLGETRIIIEESFITVREWPKPYHARLLQIASRPHSSSSAAWVDRVFSSIDRFVQTQADELPFLRVAYEQAIRELWRTRPHARASSRLGRQLELPFWQDKSTPGSGLCQKS